MRVIKGILIFITIVIVVFFMTGLFIKETTYTVDVSINKPIDEVFTAFNNKENSKKWMSDVKKIDTLNFNVGRIGSQFKMIVDNKGEDFTITEKIMAYEPNKKVTLFYDAENMLKVNDYIFNEVDGITTINLTSKCSSDSYIMSCIFPYFKSALAEQDLEYLNDFKNFVENR